MAITQRITTTLWFDNNAEEAVNYYVSIFKNSSRGRVSYYSEEGHDIHKMPAGAIMTIEFELDGKRFTALNGGPIFKFNEALSLVINCDTQEEIDYYWDKLTAGGDEQAQQCGWLKDKFGLSWQVVPTILAEMMADADQAKADRVMRAFMPMKKFDIATLQHAYDGSAHAADQ